MGNTILIAVMVQIIIMMVAVPFLVSLIRLEMKEQMRESNWEIKEVVREEIREVKGEIREVEKEIRR